MVIDIGKREVQSGVCVIWQKIDERTSATIKDTNDDGETLIGCGDISCGNGEQER